MQGVGDGSTATRSLRPGTRVLIEGPFGRLTHRPRTQHKVALIGAGVGTAPLRALADGLTYAPGEAVYLERFTHHPVFSTEVDALARGRGLRVVRLPGHRRSPGSWLGDGVPQSLTGTALRFLVPDIADRDVYVCGPGPWAELVVDSLRANGVQPSNIHSEIFGW